MSNPRCPHKHGELRCFTDMLYLVRVEGGAVRGRPRETYAIAKLYVFDCNDCGRSISFSPKAKTAWQRAYIEAMGIVD